MMPTVSSYELEEAIKLQYGLDVDSAVPRRFHERLLTRILVGMSSVKVTNCTCATYSRQDFLVIERR